jgi:hypothetical protein
MKLTVFGIILFFVCLNLSLYVLNEEAVVGDVQIQPYEDIDGIDSRLFSIDLTTETLMAALIPIGVGSVLGWVSGNLVTGGTVGLIIGVFNLFSPIARWIIVGFPVFLTQIGTPTIIVTVVQAGMSIVWLWFFIGLLVGREMQR